MLNAENLLRQIAQRRERALEECIRRYGGYVYTVVRNRCRSMLTREDQEEIASDVFLALWEHAGGIDPERLKSWLGCVARNKTADALRRARLTIPLEEAEPALDDDVMRRLGERERAETVRAALETLCTEDREIFYRFYDLCQTSGEIAAEMHMNPATVRTRLSRGRETLRQALCSEEETKCSMK